MHFVRTVGSLLLIYLDSRPAAQMQGRYAKLIRTLETNNMSKPHAVVLHITEKNCTKDQLDALISLLKKKYNFQFLGSSFTPNHEEQNFDHNGTTLVKSVSGEDPDIILAGTKRQLDNLKTGMMVRFNCQITVAATDISSDIYFIS